MADCDQRVLIRQFARRQHAFEVTYHLIQVATQGSHKELRMSCSMVANFLLHFLGLVVLEGLQRQLT
eukprot:6469222-Amphidinium_carterae.3